MQIIENLELVSATERGSVGALGNFDGVHQGHRAVIDTTRTLAQQHGAPLSVITFEPHPRTLFQADAAPFRLTDATGRAEALAALGVDILFQIPFDQNFSLLSAEDFIDRILHRTLGLRHVVIGYDFQFGHRRRGTPEMMIEQAATLGFGATRIEAVHEADGAIYSSTRIRQCLTEGDPRGAAALLGRPWSFSAVVEKGDQRGRQLGFPTANLRIENQIRPAAGVYAVKVAVIAEDNGAVDWLDGVANYGRRPTVNDRGKLFEVHLLNKNLDIYGKTLKVQLIDFIRPEIKFDGLDALQAQIAADSARATEILR
jgi:riboflavin kinase/FMN adenylyltransferase